MRPVVLSQAADGFTSWVVLDYLIAPFNVSVMVNTGFGNSYDYEVQTTFDDPFALYTVDALSRVATVATLDFKVNHTLAVGDFIAVANAGAPFDGEYSVATVVDANTITYTVANSGPTALSTAPQLLHVRRARVMNTGQSDASPSSDSSGAYTDPIRAVRLLMDNYVSGNATMTVIQAGHGGIGT